MSASSDGSLLPDPRPIHKPLAQRRPICLIC